MLVRFERRRFDQTNKVKYSTIYNKYSANLQALQCFASPKSLRKFVQKSTWNSVELTALRGVQG